MEIKKLGLLDGAEKAEGLTVVIDVFRAFSTSCYLFSNGAERILPVEKVSEAKKLAEENPDFVLIGERGGRKLPNFHYGNSPSKIVSQDFSGKTVVLTTSAGTKGLIAARDSEELLTGSLVNLGAVVDYISKKSPLKVSLVPMGKSGESPADEDELCAELMAARLKGETIQNLPSKIKSLKEGDGKRFFIEENQNWSPKEDFYLCTDLDRFAFIIKAYPFPATQGLSLKRIDI